MPPRTLRRSAAAGGAGLMPRRTLRRSGAMAVAALLCTACGAAATGTATGRATATVSATPASPSPTQAASSSPTPAASAEGWLTYHANMQRTGVDTSSPGLSSPAEAWTATLDGPVWAEPLVDEGMVLVATDGGSVYALNATTGSVVWRTHVADPMPLSDLPCGDVSPLGITGTPVIDPTTQTLYAVAETTSGSHELAALSVANGTLLWIRAVDPPGTVPRDQQQRTALALVDGRVVFGLGGLDGDCATYRGYVVSAPEDGSGPLDTYIVPVVNGAGIWEPSGPAVTASDQVFVADGNNEEGSLAATVPFDWSDSVIELTPAATETGYFAPSDWRHLGEADLDLGSTGPMIDGSDLLIAGKDGILYLLNSANLGGIGGQLASLSLGSGAFGGMALDGQTALVPTNGSLDAVQVNAASPSLSLAWSAPPTWPPIVAGGAIWAVTHSGNLVALSPTNGSQLFSLALGSVEHFTTPAASDGWVYVGASDRLVAVRGV